MIMKIFTKPWSFVWGGFLVGLAEVIHYLKYKYPIPVTTGLAQMFGSVEEHITKTDFVKRAYGYDIYWIIIGIFLGAVLVTILERENKTWVKYPWRVSMLAFFGGAIFGLGTRLAQGCTTWHYLGGIPAMSLTSIVVALVSVPFAFLAFYLMSKMGVSGFMKHQETKATVLKSVELGYKTDTLGYDASYQPYKDPLRLILMAFLFTVLLSSLWTAFQGASSSSIGHMPMLDIFLNTLVGSMLGFGIAKSGFGTECAVMAPHSLHMKPKHFESLGVARVARTMFTGLMPFVGLIIAVLMLNIAILVTWIGFGWPIPIVVESGAYNWGFHLGHLVGGPLLGIGSVLMLGCEIRTYARTGMGYMTGLAALPGFFFGYLPYTLYQKQFDKVFFGTGFIREKNILELLPNTPFIQYGFALLYTAVLIALLIWGIRKGSQMVKITPTEYATKSVDDIFIKGLKGTSNNRVSKREIGSNN